MGLKAVVAVIFERSFANACNRRRVLKVPPGRRDLLEKRPFNEYGRE